MNIRNMMTQWDFVVIIIYTIAVQILGFWVSYRRKYESDLFLAGRQLGWTSIGFSLFGTNIDPSMLIASAATAYASGMVASGFEWLAWPFIFLLSMIFIPHYLNTRISTMPEFMSRRFNEKCRVFLSWYTILNILVCWLASGLLAGSKLLAQVLGIDTDNHLQMLLCIIFLTILSTTFTVTGGLAAVAITNTVQSIFMIVASTILTLIVVHKAGGIEGMTHAVPDKFWSLWRTDDPQYPWYAMVLGYPIMGFAFWCTDQNIVQRVLGARDLKQGQYGCIFMAFLKILTPLIFYIPGLACLVLYPSLPSPDQAYTTLVANHMPMIARGMIVAVMIATLVGSASAAKNSLSTIMTLDIYCKYFNPNATPKQIRRVGQYNAVLAAALTVALSFSLSLVKNMNLFDILQSLIAYLTPPMAAVFLVGVLWRGATTTAAIATMIVGMIGGLTLGACYLIPFPRADFWPPFMIMSFLIFVGLVLFMVIVSLYTKESADHVPLPKLRESYASLGHSGKAVWVWWAVLAVVMITIFIIFS